jgi:hypothetical protein
MLQINSFELAFTVHGLQFGTILSVYAQNFVTAMVSQLVSFGRIDFIICSRIIKYFVEDVLLAWETRGAVHISSWTWWRFLRCMTLTLCGSAYRQLIGFKRAPSIDLEVKKGKENDMRVYVLSK